MEMASPGGEKQELQLVDELFPPPPGKKATTASRIRCLTFEVEERHRQAASSDHVVEVVGGQLGKGVHVRHSASVFINGRRDFIIQIVCRRKHKYGDSQTLSLSLFTPF